MTVPLNVFLSVGRTASKKQDTFVLAVKQLLLSNGLVVRTAEFSAVQPLLKIRETLEECSGAVIIAFERLYFDRGTELRGAENSKVLTDVRVPTVWNQIEAAMAYTTDLPLLVICENGLRNDGLLQQGYDWFVQWIDIDEKNVDSREFRGIFEDWKQRIERRAASPSKQKNHATDVERLTIGVLLKSLTPQQLWAVGSAFVALFVGLASLAFWLGSQVQ